MFLDKAINKPRNEIVEPISLTEPSEWLTDTTSGTTQSGAMKLSAVNACIECISNSISKLPIYIMDSATKEHKDHYLLKLLCDRPNEAMTPSVYKKLIEVNRLSSGNGYSLIVRSKRDATPRELIPLNSKYTFPWFDDTGKLWYIYTNPKTGEMRKLDNYDVLHYKAYSEDGVHGISVLTRASETINTAKAAQIYENKFYTKSARPDGVLKSDEILTKEVKDKVREEWNKIHSGIDNAFRIAVLDAGLSYQQISLSNKDTQFVESKQISIEDITRFFGVPLYKINSGKQSYSSNEQNGIEYVVSTLHPTITQYEEEDTFKLMFDYEKAQHLQVKRNMMAELRGDSTSRGSWYKNMRECGAYSVNDILALEDLPNVDGGDTRNASLNFIPLDLFRELSISRNGGSK